MGVRGDIGERLAQCKALADRSAPLTPAELREYNSLRARELARSEARRSGVTPQAALPLEQSRA